MRYDTFMENYKKRLTDARTLEDMVEESKTDHRVQKLLVAYMMKDEETLNSMKMLSKENSQARKLVKHAQLTLKSLNNDKLYQSEQMKQFLSELNSIAKFSNDEGQDENIKVANWELEGYKKMLNSYLVEERMNNLKPSLREKVSEKLSKVDWQNLITTKDKNYPR